MRGKGNNANHGSELMVARNEAIAKMLSEVEAAIGRPVQHGEWIAAGKHAYRFDICRNCGRRYANKRERGVNYRIHNAHHYCTKGYCSDCGRGPGSMDFAKALGEVAENYDSNAQPPRWHGARINPAC